MKRAGERKAEGVWVNENRETPLKGRVMQITADPLPPQLDEYARASPLGKFAAPQSKIGPAMVRCICPIDKKEGAARECANSYPIVSVVTSRFPNLLTD